MISFLAMLNLVFEVLTNRSWERTMSFYLLPPPILMLMLCFCDCRSTCNVEQITMLKDEHLEKCVLAKDPMGF